MKITNTDTRDKVYFSKLEPGDVFEFYGKIFMKILSDSPSLPADNAVNLRTGAVVRIWSEMELHDKECIPFPDVELNCNAVE